MEEIRHIWGGEVVDEHEWIQQEFKDYLDLNWMPVKLLQDSVDVVNGRGSNDSKFGTQQTPCYWVCHYNPQCTDLLAFSFAVDLYTNMHIFIIH